MQTIAEAMSVNGRAASGLPVVILSGGVTGLGVLRAFARQGIRAYVYPTAVTDPLRHSRWYRALPGVDDRKPAPTPSVAVLEKVLADSGLPGAFLCPCCDDWNRVVAEFAERPSGGFISMSPPRSALETLQNKANLAILLQTLGVPMPNTRLIDSSADISELPRSDDTFYFLKPRNSQSFRARFGTKGVRVRTIEEARRRLDEIAYANMSVVLQEYIPGSCAEHFFIDGYADHAGVIKALFARRRRRIYPPDFGNSTAMSSVPLSDVAGAVDSVHLVLAAVNYRGIFSVEFKRDPRDGAFKLLEINARPWWFVDFAVRCGVDVCRMAYDDASGREVSALETYSVGETCVFPYQDFFAMQPLVAARQASWLRWLVEVTRALQPVGCLDDPMPAIVGTARLLARALRNRLTNTAETPSPVLE
jgi:predicted ATP-grasp superfamily ATP-dependent carboligase